MQYPRLCTVNNQQPLQASKWLQVQVLLDSAEMGLLFDALGEFTIFLTGTLQPRGSGAVSHKGFLIAYADYVEHIKKGEEPLDISFRPLFSSVFTKTVEALYLLDAGNEQVIIRPSHPVIQLQLHRLGFSHMDQKFRSMVFGKDSLSWGIQFSYPQVFQDPVTKQILTVNESSEFPNTNLFRTLQRWVRHHTLPTPFLVGNKRINVPVRLGKNSFSWINHHPGLSQHELNVLHEKAEG